ncbi:MAG: hypothetical protein WC847_02360 [Candidatus Paceibacterota bacterium]|jgi:D-alanine-D-alanine ligase-like ATP-grasp enzyme
MKGKKENKIKRVGVLRGGAGKNYASSLQKGGEIINQIFENLSHKYKVIDILIDTDGVWHLSGVPIKPADLYHKVDIIWNTSNPNISVTLDNLVIPNVGNSPYVSALQNSNAMLKEHAEKLGMQMPRSIVLPLYQKDFDGPRELYAIKKAKEVFEKFSSPWIVKSFTEDTSMGIHLAQTFPELIDAIEDGVKHEKSILVEEFIAGKVASVHSVSGFRMGDLPAQAGDIYTFPLGNSFGNFSQEEKERLSKLAKDLHKSIDAKYYLKSNFVLSPFDKVYLLGIGGTLDPNDNSHFSQVCESVGAKTHHIIDHILEKGLMIQ